MPVDAFHKNNRSPEYVQCIERLQEIAATLPSLPENERGLVEAYVRNTFAGKPSVQNSPHNILSQDELDALNGPA